MRRESRILRGTITTWNDDRGFGFISPTPEGERIFVHISAFSGHPQRPLVGDVVEYHSGYSADGRPRAISAWRAGGVRASRRRRAGSGSGSYVVVLAFVALFFAVSAYWETPIWVAGFYVLVSLFCFAMYAIDKSAAVSGGWRVSEATLFWLGLIGGWPGAVFAQQIFRHKTIKPGFRAMHWASAILNITAFVVICSPSFSSVLSRISY